ncbi:MAG: alpha/beta hydrolase [Oscillospiraceae bacterium]|nr:alpha/beta hydrolase [Oscillospiraceae bacterium]
MKFIYLHGLGQTAGSWEKAVPPLGLFQDAICPDLSKLLAGAPVSYDALYSSFCALCDGLEAPLNLCGLSLGGTLALHYAIEHPLKVNSLVLIAAQYKMPKALLAFQNMVFRFMKRSMFRQMGFEKEDLIRLCKTMMELDFSGSLGQISCPVLIVCGEKDKANLRASQELFRALPHSMLQVIPGAGHEVNIESPEKLSAALCDFYLGQ